MKNIMYQFGVAKNGNVVELQHVLLKVVKNVQNGANHLQVPLL